MKKSFKRDWILYNSIASIVSLVTYFLYPFFITVSVVVIQVIILRRYLKWRALLWILNPFLVSFGIFIASENLIYGVLLTSFILEFIFFITIGKFSKMIWSLIIGIFTTLGIFLIDNFRGMNSVLVVIQLVLLTVLLWVIEAHYLNKILKTIPVKIEKSLSSEILDAP
ncbi:MAG: hypothetical protein CMP67_07420 [Flavobacteriales bacterium]|nr:hypothetical protein [Flavobacteriales bacterium]|tara:strand:+ start:632 stop:1135 length:504 start_codon:yes stop_codon:yes gene_type:complete